MPKLPQLGDNLISTAIAAITTVLAGLNAFVSQFLLPPFWRDLFVSVLLVGVLIDQCLKTRTAKRELALAGAAGGPSGASLIPAYVVAVLLAAVTIATVFPVAVHIARPHWRLCGTFKTNTPAEGSCLVVYDSRNRQVSDECTPIDDSHHVGGLTGESWGTYKPVTYSIRRNGKDGPHHPLDKDMFTEACGSVKVEE